MFNTYISRSSRNWEANRKMERKRSVRRRQKPPFSQRAKDHCRSFTAFMFSNVGIIFLVVLYTILGKLTQTIFYTLSIFHVSFFKVFHLLLFDVSFVVFFLKRKSHAIIFHFNNLLQFRNKSNSFINLTL